MSTIHIVILREEGPKVPNTKTNKYESEKQDRIGRLKIDDTNSKLEKLQGGAIRCPARVNIACSVHGTRLCQKLSVCRLCYGG